MILNLIRKWKFEILFRRILFRCYFGLTEGYGRMLKVCDVTCGNSEIMFSLKRKPDGLNFDLITWQGLNC